MSVVKRRKQVLFGCPVTTRVVFGLLLVAMVTSLATVPARAGGEETTDKEARRLSRLWRSEGAKALPGVLTALCSDASDAFVRAAAEDFLVEIGPTSVEALLDRAVSGQCASNVDIVGSTLPRAICADLTKQKRSLPPASTARLLRPIVAALDGLDEARAVVSLKVVARASVHDPCPLWPAVVKAVAGPATRLLARVNERHRGEVLAALASLGPAAAPALPIATSLLDDAPARPAALLLLGSIGPASAPSVPRITQILDSAKEPAAAEALGMIGTPALPALPKLLSLLSDASGDGCRKPPLPMNVLIGAIAALAESAPAGSSLRNDAVAALRTARQGCPKLDTWFAGALERLGVH